jgi:hypothetical protein
MKHFVKTSKVPRLGKQIKQLVEKLNETSEEVTKRRSTVSFSPKDIQQVVRVNNQRFQLSKRQGFHCICEAVLITEQRSTFKGLSVPCIQ